MLLSAPAIFSREELQAAFLGGFPAADWPSRIARESILAVHFDPRDWLDWRVPAATFLDPAECDRVSRLRRRPDRDLRIVAYALHRLLLAAVMDIAPDRVPLARDGKGCPRLPGTGVETSLSHANGCIALAVSLHGRVGIDAETMDRAPGMPEIAERICHPDELGALGALAPDRYERELLALWVRKEALLKACGVGLAIEMSHFRAPADIRLPWPTGASGGAMVRMSGSEPDVAMAIAHPDGARLTDWAWVSRPA